MRPTRRHLRRALALTLTALLLAACKGDQEVDRVAPTPLPAPTSPSPSPSPTPIGPPAVLTGVPVPAADADRPALAVKIENTAKARPQAGLEDADLVIEAQVEGGITRFLAVFQSTLPAEIGPIRSARLVDATLLPALDGLFLFSGGRSDVKAAVGGTALLLPDGTEGTYRSSGRSAPSNLMADPVRVYAAAAERDPDVGPPPTWWTFDEEVPDGARDCADGSCDGTSIDVSMSAQNTSGWRYDAAEGVYRREQNGTPQPTASGDPVGAANVVVIGSQLSRGGCCDTSGSPFVVIQTTGEGRAVVLRDGEWYEAMWSRASSEAPFEITVDGQPLPFKPGPTWLHLTPAERLPAAPETP